MQQNHQLTAHSPLNDWLRYLEQQHYKSIDLGLERIKAEALRLNLTKPAPFVITVGGTNGKGTTCRLLERILGAIGLKVGVYSSPHLVRYNERVRIAEQELDDLQHTQAFAFIEQYRQQSLTYFEFSTLSAFYLFQQAKLDVVILEVGLGGRLDATNIVDADIAVITAIDIDHTDFLGSDREAIALEKAGIFRPHKPAIIGEPNIPQTLIKYAERLQTPLFCRDRDWHYQQSSQTWRWYSQKQKFDQLPLCNIPTANAATALAVLEHLPFDIPRSVLLKSLAEVQLTGRFQLLTAEQKQTLAQRLACPNLPHIILDVGHNPHAAQYLAQRLMALKQPSVKIAAICGILQDKDSQGIFEALVPVIDQWYCISLAGSRGQTGQALKNSLTALRADCPCEVAESMQQAIQTATVQLQAEDYLLIFGSFYTVAQALAFIE